MRVVVDTNVFVSSFFGGNPRKVIDQWLSGGFTLCLSRPILEEYFDVLGRFEFDDSSLLLKLALAVERSNNVLFVESPGEEPWIADDPADNKFIACAIALKADCIVSGDSHLTLKKKVSDIMILTPSEMLKL